MSLTNEHVPHIGLREPGGQHPGIHAGEEHSGRLRVVTDLESNRSAITLLLSCIFSPNLLELLDHAAPEGVPVLDDALEELLHALAVRRTGHLLVQSVRDRCQSSNSQSEPQCLGPNSSGSRIDVRVSV